MSIYLLFEKVREISQTRSLTSPGAWPMAEVQVDLRAANTERQFHTITDRNQAWPSTATILNLEVLSSTTAKGKVAESDSSINIAVIIFYYYIKLVLSDFWLHGFVQHVHIELIIVCYVFFYSHNKNNTVLQCHVLNNIAWTVRSHPFYSFALYLDCVYFKQHHVYTL